MFNNVMLSSYNLLYLHNCDFCYTNPSFFTASTCFHQDLDKTLDSVLGSFLAEPIMNLKRINAVDISFGSSGFKMLIAAMDTFVKVRFAQV